MTLHRAGWVWALVLWATFTSADAKGHKRKRGAEPTNNILEADKNETVIHWISCPPTGLEGHSDKDTVDLDPDSSKPYALYSPGYISELIGFPPAATSYYTCKIIIKFNDMVVRPQIFMPQANFTLNGTPNCGTDVLTIYGLINVPTTDADNRFRGQINRVKYCTILTSDKNLFVRSNELHVNVRVNSSVNKQGFKIIINYPNA